MRRYEANHNDDYPVDTTREVRQVYTFEVVINNDHECTKAIRMPGPPLHTSYVKLEPDAAYVRVMALDIVSAIHEAFELAAKTRNDAEVLVPCA